MVEAYIKDRIIFPSKSSQINFLFRTKKAMNKNIKQIANDWKMNRRTVSDWMKAKHLMPYDLARLCEIQYGIKIPKTSKIKSWNEHLRSAGIKGGKANKKKNGGVVVEEKYRKLKWREWWEIKGKFIPQGILTPKEISIPKLNNDLAEFVGIMLGDGSITKYCIKISLNKSELIYLKFIQKLIRDLFNTPYVIYKSKISNGMDIIVQRKMLVEYLVGIGLMQGNKIKNNVSVPEWIMNNVQFQKSCIRGLIDTDGCIFVHRYKSNNKIYEYQKIDFTSASRSLLDSAYKILINLGFGVRISKNSKYLRIENQRDVKRYLEIIGTNNPRY